MEFHEQIWEGPVKCLQLACLPHFNSDFIQFCYLQNSWEQPNSNYWTEQNYVQWICLSLLFGRVHFQWRKCQGVSLRLQEQVKTLHLKESDMGFYCAHCLILFARSWPKFNLKKELAAWKKSNDSCPILIKWE